MTRFVEKKLTAPLDAEAQAAMTSAEALDRLRVGNSRFLAGKRLPRDHGLELRVTATGQYPFAVVLGCIDSRVPHEIIFDAGIGDLFSARIAGNFVNSDILGSLEFATAVAGAKLVVVLGHSECGAVKGACDDVQLGHLTNMLSRLKPSVEAIQGIAGPRDSTNAAFVQAVAYDNVARTVAQITRRSEVISELVDAQQVQVVGAMHHLHTGRVEFLD